MRAKVTQLCVVVAPKLKEHIWEEASRLHMTPSEWIRYTLERGFDLSKTTPAPDQYVITLTEKQAIKLRKLRYKVDYRPIED